MAVWDVDKDHQVGATWPGHTSWVQSVSIRADDMRVASGASDHCVRV